MTNLYIVIVDRVAEGEEYKSSYYFGTAKEAMEFAFENSVDTFNVKSFKNEVAEMFVGTHT